MSPKFSFLVPSRPAGSKFRRFYSRRMRSIHRTIKCYSAFCLLLLLLSGTQRCLGEEEVLADEDIAAGHRTETDVTEALREADMVSGEGSHEFRKGSEQFGFQAEVNRLMDILVNSLYSNKDIFLRELISNAADALDKVRLLSLTDKSQLDGAEDLEIRVSLDHEKNILRIKDTGIGMTKQHLIDNLGTIAKSGTSAFLETLQKGGDVNLIGQFGVGFYSIFLVADYVEVVSKHKDDGQWIWESKADGNFAVSKDTENEPLGRGTQINIYLKEETQEYASESKLRELVGRYSEFINFPIYLYESKSIDVPVEEPEEEAQEKSTVSEDGEIEDEEEEAETPSEPKIEKKTVWDWVLLNDNKPIWLRSASEVTSEEYNNFYKSLSKSTDEPLASIHFKGEGDVEFRSILFIPPKAPPGILDNYYNQKSGLDLYVRRVFITNNFDELVPRYLGFLKGLVDSDTLPLSVSREVLQEHASLKVIKKKIVRKTLDSLKQLADADTEEAEDDGEKSLTGKYTTFWNQFGKLLKLGIIEDSSNRQRLAKLLRFYTSKSTEKLVSLEEYIERMKPNQKKIYFFIGEGAISELSNSPYLEKLIARDLEVIYFTESVDEYLMQHLTEFEETQFQNAAKEKLTLGGKDDQEKKKEKALREEFKPLVKWWKELLGTDVSQVRVSRRLAKTPAIVVAGQYGYSANLEKVMKAQAVSDQQAMMMKMKDRILEVNPRHPLVEELKKRYDRSEESEQTKNMARIIFDSALLESGYELSSPKDFNQRIYEVLAQSLQTKTDFRKGTEFESEDADEVAVEDDDVEAINPPEDLSGNIKVEEDVEPGESDSKEEL